MTLNSPSNNEYSNPDRLRLLEALEACRPGSDDFDRLLEARSREAVRADAGLTARYRRLQRLDGVIGRAFADVPVPVGLDARLMAALAADALVGRVEASSSEASRGENSWGEASRAQVSRAQESRVAAPTSNPLHASAAAPVEPARFSRRGWLAVCGATAAATAAGLAGLWLLRSNRPGEMTVEQLLDEAFALHEQLEDRLPPAVEVDLRNPPVDFPMSAKISRRAGIVPRRRPLDGRLLGRPGSAYELAGPGAPRATLYVLGDGSGSHGVVGVPDSVSGHPDKTTGNRALGAWREGGLLYVFVVEGDAERYRRFFAESGGVFA
jgi:hypothetical protein